MAKYVLKLDKETCQSNFICTAVDPTHFEEADDGKAGLIGGSRDDHIESLEIDEDEKQAAQQAADGCPVLAIELVDDESGETLAP